MNGRKKKCCDLCGGRAARVHCDSDEASLCLECDGKVHGVNFLVARHSRTLLCGGCGWSPTPWRSSGPRLLPAVSLCDACSSCAARRHRRSSSSADKRMVEVGDEEGSSSSSRERDTDTLDDDDDDGEDQYSEDDDDDVEEEEEQVVPGTTSTADPPPPTPTASSSSSPIGWELEDEEEEEETSVRRKRKRQNVADLPCSFSSQDQLPVVTMRIREQVHDEIAPYLLQPSEDCKKPGIGRSDSHQLPMDLVSSGSGFPPI